MTKFPAKLFIVTVFLFADSHHSPGRKTSLYGGDIKFTPKQQENMKKYGNPYGQQSRAASNVDKERWPNAVIPYTFDCSVGELILMVPSVRHNGDLNIKSICRLSKPYYNEE